MKHEHNGTEPILSFKLVWLCQARFRWFYEVYKVYTAFLTIKAQMPLTFRARLSLWVRLHSNSITPDSSIGCTKQKQKLSIFKLQIQFFLLKFVVCTSLLGENSRSRLHSVEEAMTKTSSGAFCNSWIPTSPISLVFTFLSIFKNITGIIVSLRILPIHEFARAAFAKFRVQFKDHSF